MPTKQMIEVEGLPEGWKATEFRPPKDGENFFLPASGILTAKIDFLRHEARLIVEKIQPRRIVLEETNDVFGIRKSGYRVYSSGIVQHIENAVGSDIGEKIWREVKENDLSLPNEEPKLSLSVDECIGLFEGHQPTITKVKEFIKDK